MNQLHAEGSLKSPKRAPSLPLAWGVSLALAAFMIGLILARSGNRISSGKEQRAETIQLIATNALPAGEKILAYSAKLEQPMKSEIDALLFDTKTAVRSLAMQFLPESTMD
ncbi:MAG: hypothetical protein SFY81_15100 [Verrucomicrobiota bacterium]|nr:hypothetical protein [Verrucomicrobiota bacterium]